MIQEITIGFIGGGRMSKILLQGWKHADKLPDQVVVTDINPDVLERLKRKFPTIQTAVDNPFLPAECDIVILGLHPPAVGEILRKINKNLRPSSILISLAPKISIAKISETITECKNIVRINPNAPSIVNTGYNPIAFAKNMGSTERRTVLELFVILGDCPEVPEYLLESFAMITAMGPTYLWFQLYELQDLAKTFGLTAETLKEAIPKMVYGTIRTMYEADLTPAEVMDLIPVKPLGEEELAIRGFYRDRLTGLYNKLRS